jgi:hypothetical protein
LKRETDDEHSRSFAGERFTENMITQKPNAELAIILQKPWWTKTDLATVFGVSLKTVFNWQRHGLIPFVRLGGTIRFDPVEVKQAILKRRCGCLYDEVTAGEKGSAL